MLSRDKCQKLKDAGLPQEVGYGDRYYNFKGERKRYGNTFTPSPNKVILCPDLEYLIAQTVEVAKVACGDYLNDVGVSWFHEMQYYEAMATCDLSCNDIIETHPTDPIKAVANLYIALTKKVREG